MSNESVRTWIEVKHPELKGMVGKYCPQTHEIEVKQGNKTVKVKLPESGRIKS